MSDRRGHSRFFFLEIGIKIIKCAFGTCHLMLAGVLSRKSNGTTLRLQ